MKKILLLFAFFCALKANAQNYFINFTGTGAATTISTVKVENLDAGISLILTGDQILHLTSMPTGVNQIENKQSSELKIYPNPMTGSSILQIYPPEDGTAMISVIEMSGKPVAQFQRYLENSLQEFRLSGINSGFYLISITGNTYQYSGKLLCNSNGEGTISIVKIINNEAVIEKKSKTDSKGVQAAVDMRYSIGDTLKFTGISENYNTIMTDIPTSDKTVSLNFLPCTDGDNNNYPVVQIGTQFWMAENLKTTKYSNGTSIPHVNTIASWSALTPTDKAYCWYNDDISNKDTYGALYTWEAAMNGEVTSITSPRDVQGACPTGWHLPGITEWNTLSTYLGGSYYASRRLQEAGTAHWIYPDPMVTNKSGFTGLPGGYRHPQYGTFFRTGAYWWSTSVFQGSSSAWAFFIPFNYAGTGYFAKSEGNSVRCLKNDIQTTKVPSISTSQVLIISSSSATCGGNISTDGGTNISVRGVCWGISANPTIADYYTSDGTGTGTFSSNITGLTPNTGYYVRAYATNSKGTAYGNELFFTPRTGAGTVSDIDGNTYSTVVIGTQTWMAENLKTTKYYDGTAISLSELATWYELITPAYCWNKIDKATYGALYNWYAVSTGKLCPTGWHVPIDGEWMTLATYLGGSDVAGGKLKEAGTTHWLTPNNGATNETGFTALPGGRHGSQDDSIGYGGYWWSITEFSSPNAYSAFMHHTLSGLAGLYQSFKIEGYSVRCVKN